MGFARKRGKTREEAKELIWRCSGHPRLAGFLTRAAAGVVPALKMRP
ncbi:MAG: hypothetical protein J2P50_06845 [Hyphomicrobiaceae bacterium]|nr:hypothetical protein [Hyphomicrobiaceae bacterium]